MYISNPADARVADAEAYTREYKLAYYPVVFVMLTQNNRKAKKESAWLSI